MGVAPPTRPADTGRSWAPENRQNLLGHLALLGAVAAGPADGIRRRAGGRLGGAVDELLGDWADRCHAEGGLVVGRPLPAAVCRSRGGHRRRPDRRRGDADLRAAARQPPILEWYRFLNCGYRLPVLGGTDKMSAEVPVGAIRTYARIDPGIEATPEAWAAAVRAGRTFASLRPDPGAVRRRTRARRRHHHRPVRRPGSRSAHVPGRRSP